MPKNYVIDCINFECVNWLFANVDFEPPWFWPGISKGVGFIRFDQRHEAEQAIKALNGTIPKNSTDPIVVKFANNPNNGKLVSPLMSYVSTPNSRPRHANFNPTAASNAAVAVANAAAAIQHSTGVNRFG